MSEDTKHEPDTRKKILDTAFEEIYLNGYQGASLNRIIEKSGFTKGALYHYFKSKKELALAAISETMSVFLKQYWELPLLNQPDPLCALINHLKNLPTIVFEHCKVFEIKHGCPLNNLIQEMSPIDEDFARILEKHFNEWQDILTKIIEQAKTKGQVEKDVNPADAAMFLLSCLEGCITTAKKSNSMDIFIRCTAQIEHYINSLKA
ncbi:MAG: TetR/AcrR family transcriptional regulator [Nitrospirae bacterium]|nr:TetR/AcrR family transcriptional regulator [Nitrospirota bacterium]MBF0536043.1 TetR/AcrR family transcriptional regulator [Nitrospirota bacterium]MBF0617931.1 TetR/AcrR family transcriptional regulator [Nitrospirota bacterium]